MRLIVYLRVSTATQVENGAGLEVQEAACKTFAEQHGHTITETLREEGVSGAKADRPMLARALAAVRNGEADAIIVARLDRLARDVVLQELLVRELDGKLLSAVASENELLADPNDPGRKMMRQILGSFAEYERSMIALRLATGRAAKRARGGKGSGSYPFGWTKEGQDEREQGVLEAISALRAGGHPPADIAAWLNSRPDMHPRRATEWTVRGVKRLAFP